jgi:HD-GYP domain-containing protein (c-di-GMP phosphodiesterase class II)
MKNTEFLHDRDQVVDDHLVKVVGPAISTFLVRVIKASEMFSVDHNQVRVAAREFTDWLGEQFDRTREDAFTLQLTEKNFFINGQLLRLDARAFQRAVNIRKTFLQYDVNSVQIRRGIAPGEIVALVEALRQLRDGELASLALVDQPHLDLASVTEQDFDVPDKDERRLIIELYAGLLVKCNVYFNRLKKGGTPSARHIKRLVQRITDELDDRGDVFIGLINLELIRGQDFVHAVNTCIYSMMLAHAIELSPVDIVRCGMTALSQNIERFLNPEEEEQFEPGDEAHFQTNLSSMTTLSTIGAADVLSALRLVTSYERGFPFNKPLPRAWYRDELRPHLLSRIIEIARHYDVLTQGLEGVESRTPDRALQTLTAKMGAHYDPNLMRLFVNVVGIYPVGAVVELSTGDRALVIRSPALVDSQRLSNANRPTVKMLDGSGKVVDLGQSKHAGIRVQRIVEDDDVSDRPGAFFLF